MRCGELEALRRELEALRREVYRLRHGLSWPDDE